MYTASQSRCRLGLTTGTRSTDVHLRHGSGLLVRDVVEMCLYIIPELKLTRRRAAHEVLGDQFAGERSGSCEVLVPISVCSDGRTKSSRRLVVVRESGAHLFMVTPTTGEGQGQRSRLGIDIMGMTAPGRSARSRPGSMTWKGRTTLVLSIGSQHHGECGVSPLVEWSTGERRRLVPLTKRLPSSRTVPEGDRPPHGSGLCRPIGHGRGA